MGANLAFVHFHCIFVIPAVSPLIVRIIIIVGLNLLAFEGQDLALQLRRHYSNLDNPLWFEDW